jgi:hypothetical protein
MWESVQNNECAITIKFEDVFSSDGGVEVMTHLMEWLGIVLRKSISGEAIADRQNISEGSAGSSWDEECDHILRMHCSEMMKRFGYHL